MRMGGVSQGKYVFSIHLEEKMDMVEYKYIKLVGEKREWESIENRKIDLSQLGDSFHIVIGKFWFYLGIVELRICFARSLALAAFVDFTLLMRSFSNSTAT